MPSRFAQLSNGLQIIAECDPQAVSSALGFFVGTGARHERAEENGVSHFLEHMAFKGNAQYTADDVNRLFDEVGVQYNAYTGEETTVYYAAVLPEYVPPTLGLLSNLLRPSLRKKDFITEKQVILEEIGMYADSPAFSLQEQAMLRYFKGHPLGRSILGSKKSVSALSPEVMREYHKNHYRAGHCVLAATGRIVWDQLLSLATDLCGDWPGGTTERVIRKHKVGSGTHWIRNSQLHQQHVVLMSPAPPAESPLRFAADLMSVIVGDEVNSRLYWELIDNGDAEAADLNYQEFSEAGLWMTYLCCESSAVEDLIARLQRIYTSVVTDGVTETELEQARNKVAARIVLQGERPMNRLGALGSNWLQFREYRSVEDDLQMIRSLTQADLQELMRLYPLALTTVVGLGPHG